MVATVAAPVAPQASLPGLNVASYGTATAYPIGLSTDRRTFYGTPFHSGGLYQSVDDGVTWTLVHTFTSEWVQGIIETDDGEAVVITQNVASTPGYVYKSSGWATSHTTATWTKVLTSVAGYFPGYWAATPWTFGDDTILAGTSKYGIICEYGAQYNNSGDGSTNALRAYFTSDYGATWTQVLNLMTQYPGKFPLHCHSAAFDPYWDRLWVAYGDTQGAGAGYSDVLYSDDHGATWNTLPLPAGGWSTQSLQSTTIMLTADAFLLGSDNAPGILRFPRKSYRVLGEVQEALDVTAGTNAMIAERAWRNRRSNDPLLMGVLPSTTVRAPQINMSRDGASWSVLWRDELLRTANMGVIDVVGPSVNGVVLARVSRSSTVMWQLRGTIVQPPGGMLDGEVVATGDGTTTVFTAPHYLGTTPTRVQGWSTNAAGGAFTVTADATNVIVTFAVAPGAAVSCWVSWRAGL